MSQNDQTHFKNLAAFAARFLKCDHFGTLRINVLKIIFTLTIYYTSGVQSILRLISSAHVWACTSTIVCISWEGLVRCDIFEIFHISYWRRYTKINLPLSKSTPNLNVPMVDENSCQICWIYWYWWSMLSQFSPCKIHWFDEWIFFRI